MKYRLGIAILFFAVILFFAGSPIRNPKNFLASLVFPDSITAQELKEKYQSRKVKVLIVPGHDDESRGGAQFQGIREADLNLSLAKELFQLFNDDSHFEAFLTRDESGYRPEFYNYFTQDYSKIISFRDRLRQAMERLFQQGLVEKRIFVRHNTASEKDFVKLYGINKWGNENDVDLVIHIHFNDYPGRKLDSIGKYSGFSIYIPEGQLPNAFVSKAIGQKVLSSLDKILAVSDYPKEDAGIIEDQELIAIGANASLNAAALLIEYGYIYESPLRNEKMREYLFSEIAYQSYAGVKKFFEPDYKVNQYDSKLLPNHWKGDLSFDMTDNIEVAALQRALIEEGIYSGAITGNFREITRQGVIEFQKKHGLDPIPNTGYVGPYTRQVLNDFYSK